MNISKGYRLYRGKWILGTICLALNSMLYNGMDGIFDIYMKIVLTALSYVLVLMSYKDAAESMEYQVVYYDVVEKDAIKVQW